MSDVTTKVIWNEGLKFTGVSERGHETVIDGNSHAGPSPMVLLLEALGACSAIDVVDIMGKMRTPLARLEVVLDGDRRALEPRYYENVRFRFDAWGNGIKIDKLTRAISLSIGKYCSVFHSLRADLKLEVEYRLHAAGAEADGEYQTVELAPPTGELL